MAKSATKVLPTTKAQPAKNKSKKDSSSSSSSSSSSDEEPVTKAVPTKISPAKSAAVVNKPVPTNKFPKAKDSSSSESSDSDDEPAHVVKKQAVEQPKPAATPVQKKQHIVEQSKPTASPANKKVVEQPKPPAPTSAPPAQSPVRCQLAVHTTTQVNANFEAACTGCGKNLKINVTIT